MPDKASFTLEIWLNTKCQTKPAPVNIIVEEENIEDPEDEQPFDMKWPKDDSLTAKVIYVFLFVINVSLWITLPDMRRPEKQKFMAFSFFGSIVWIGLFRLVSLFLLKVNNYSVI